MRSTPPVTLVLRGATIYDGTGGPPLVADVSIAGDRIHQVGGVIESTGVPEVDLSGLSLSPGFIDTHTHDDFAVLLHPDMAFKVCGGVTTCIVGNCGMGAAPIAKPPESPSRSTPTPSSPSGRVSGAISTSSKPTQHRSTSLC